MASWVGYPKSYTKGRERPVQYVVIHCTAGSEAPDSAENGAHYDKIRTDGTSTHLFVDSNSAVREVPDTDRSHHARHHGNEIGLGVELCGAANQSDSQWHDAASSSELKLAAKEVAKLCYDHGLPAKRLSVAQVRAAYYAPAGHRPFGICGHWDVTRAYPEDQGDHTDPGEHFPWDEFLGMVQAELDDEGDDTLAGITDNDAQALIWRVKTLLDNSPTVEGGPKVGEENKLHDALVELSAKLDQVLAALAGGVQVPAVVEVSDASVAKIADAVNDAAAARLTD